MKAGALVQKVVLLNMPTSLELFIEMGRLALAGQTVMVVSDHIDQKCDGITK